jgi:hypothetical protein
MALNVFPSSRAILSASFKRSGGREMVFFTAVPISFVLPSIDKHLGMN